MSPLALQRERQARDLAGLYALQRRYPALLTIRAVEGSPPHRIELAVHIPTAVDPAFPRRRRPASRVLLQLPARYPVEPARVTAVDHVYNPNVFPSGTFCLGNGHRATRTLAETVLQAMRILALDPEVINCTSPANYEAALWFAPQRAGGLFPTVDLGQFEVRSAGTIPFREPAASSP
jgi:hypothetical protein